MRLELIISLIIFFNACNNASSGSEKEYVNDIEFKILNEKILAKQDSVSLEVEVTNNTDSSFLMFAFGLTHEALTDESFYIDNLNFTSGTALFILDQNGKTLEQHEPSSDYIGFENLKEKKKKTDEVYLDQKLILKPNEKIQLSLTFNFKYFKPKAGEYDIYLIYYSGRNLYNFVPEEKVRAVEKKYNAKEFRGWIKSNTVKLVME